MANKNQTKQIHYQRPQLAHYQIDAIFNDARYGIIEASTKSGKTAGCVRRVTTVGKTVKTG